MRSLTESKLSYLAIGAILTLVAVSAYWQSNKQDLAKKVLGGIAQGDICADDSLEMTASTNGTDKEVYFVGCGGFF